MSLDLPDAPEPPAAPLRYLSSADSGWDGLEAEAFHEPPELEGLFSPATSATSLILFAGGPMRFERRRANGQWAALTVRQGDLMLRAGGSGSWEVRWRALSSQASRTLHLRLGDELLSRAAAELTDGEPRRSSLVGRSGIPLAAAVSPTPTAGRPRPPPTPWTSPPPPAPCPWSCSPSTPPTPSAAAWPAPPPRRRRGASGPGPSAIRTASGTASAPNR